jgi:hypothetical protein
LSIDDPVLSYEQNQLETFSMRTDRCCTYSISIQFWHNGARVHRSTGMRKHRFGKAKSKTTRAFEIEIPIYYDHSIADNQEEIQLQQIFVQYAFIFPPD